MEFSEQAFTHFVPKFDQILAFLANINKSSIYLESPHFQTVSTKYNECKIQAERKSWKIKLLSWKTHGIFCTMSVGPLIKDTMAR